MYQKNLVRAPFSEVPLLCCWDDCGQYGDNNVRVAWNEKGTTVYYIFCSEGHKDFWVNSKNSYGNHSRAHGKTGLESTVFIPGAK